MPARVVPGRLVSHSSTQIRSPAPAQPHRQPVTPPSEDGLFIQTKEPTSPLCPLCPLVSMDLFILLHSPARLAPSFASITDDAPNNDEMNLYFHCWLWNATTMAVAPGEDPNVTAKIHVGLFDSSSHTDDGGSGGSGGGGSVAVRPIWQHRADGGVPFNRLAERSQQCHGNGVRFSPCNVQFQLTHEPSAASAASGATADTDTNVDANADADGGGGAPHVATFFSCCRVMPHDMDTLEAGGQRGRGPTEPRTVVTFHVLPDAGEAGAIAAERLRSAVESVVGVGGDGGGDDGSDDGGRGGGSGGGGRGGEGGDWDEIEAIAAAVCAVGGFASLVGALQRLIIDGKAWEAGRAAAEVAEGGGRGSAGAAGAAEAAEGGAAEAAEGGAAGAAGAAAAETKEGGGCEGKAGDGGGGGRGGFPVLDAVSGMTDLEFSPRHGFPNTPHIGVYGDNYAPFAPFLIVRGHYDTRDAALPSSSFLPPDVAAWASLDAEMLQEQEGAAEESAPVVALKQRHQQDQTDKTAAMMNARNAHNANNAAEEGQGHGQGQGQGQGQGEEEDPVEAVARMQRGEADMVQACTGIDFDAALALVERCGSAADAIEFHFDQPQ